MNPRILTIPRCIHCLAASLLAFGLVHSARAGVTLEDTAGKTIDPVKVDSADKVNVLIFAISDCPISNSYAPAIAELQKQFGPQGVRFYVIYCDPDLSAADASKHQADYQIPAAALLDPEAKLAKQIHADVTSEVFVVKPDGAVAYHGPIDDQYAAVGRKRTTVHHTYLADALTDLLAGRAVKVPSADAFGCPLHKGD